MEYHSFATFEGDRLCSEIEVGVHRCQILSTVIVLPLRMQMKERP